jgi:hypothetical protein
VSLADALEVNSTLKVLVLSANQLRGSNLAPVIAQNSSLRVLDLSANPLSPLHLVSLVRSLRQNKHLVVFKAPQTSSEEGSLDDVVRELGVTLRTSCLEHLEIDIRGVSDAALTGVCQVLETANKALVKLELNSERAKNDPWIVRMMTAVHANRLLEEKKLTAEALLTLSEPLSDLLVTKVTMSRSPLRLPGGHDAAARFKRSPEDYAIRCLESLSLQPGAADSELSQDEEELISKSYGASNVDYDVNEERSLVSSSAFFDSPQVQLPARSSVADHGMPVDSESYPAIPRRASSLSAPQLLSQQTDPQGPLQIELLKGQLKQLEHEVTLAMKSLASRVTETEQTYTAHRGLHEDLEGGIRSLEASSKRLQLRLEKSEQESTEFSIDSRRLQRQTEDRLTTLERKETAKLALFEEIGNEIDGLKAGVEECRRGEHVKGLIELLSQRQDTLERAFTTQQSLYEEQRAEVLRTVRQEISSAVLATVAELTEARDAKTQTELDKLRAQVKALEAETAAKVKKSEDPRRDTQVRTTVRKIERRLENIEDFLGKLPRAAVEVTDTPLASSRSGSAQIATVLSKLEERLVEIEREQANYTSTKRRVAEVVVRTRQKRVKILEETSKPRREGEVRDTSPKHSMRRDDSIRARLEKKQTSAVSSHDHVQAYESSMEEALGSSELGESGAYLQDRIAMLEKLRLHKQAHAYKTEATLRPSSAQPVLEKPTEPEVPPQLETGYVPGSTESLVLQALSQRHSKHRLTQQMQLKFSGIKALSPLSASFNSMANYSATQSPMNSGSTGMPYKDDGRLPSDELQEQLKLRGFQVRESRY